METRCKMEMHYGMTFDKKGGISFVRIPKLEGEPQFCYFESDKNTIDKSQTCFILSEDDMRKLSKAIDNALNKKYENHTVHPLWETFEPVY